MSIKFEKAGPNQTVVIDRTSLYTRDGWTDREVQSNMPPLLRKGYDKMLFQFTHRAEAHNSVVCTADLRIGGHWYDP